MMLLFLIAAIAFLILPEELVAILMPVIVWLASGFVNWLKATLGSSGFGGTVLVTLVVPAFSLLFAWLGNLIQPDMGFWTLFAIGLAGTFINEVLKQWQQTIGGKQTKANKDLIG